ncbi:hypothetical protein J1G44_03950 [Cellulomonas sp. zg-ZUI199]|uniref:Uncharacterized protein n=1 Tax=Cellulomonas wangleii TaxID=2816956 RepID=A0ABX8D4J0_9CELL|nr:hypothetical protein [Cellulomonas wangleii]MBO0923631.1 hypothetical protein [Cellulomonas wangleii]QVI61953.1 hypothetical protein KG103_16235 [Cellulomonas wangleii]
MSSDSTYLAPHVTPTWRDAFVLELRLRDVRGDAIGDALAEVDAHCADSGQDAATAFGDPAGYARGLTDVLPTHRRTPARDVVAVVLQTAGVMGTVWSVPPWLRGEPLTASTGPVVTAVLCLVVAVVLCLAPARPLGWFARARWWQAALAGAAATVAVVAPGALLPNAPLTAPSAPLAAASILLLAVGAAALFLDGTLNDDVRGPGDAAPRRHPRLRAALLSTALPAVALLVAGGLALLPL